MRVGPNVIGLVASCTLTKDRPQEDAVRRQHTNQEERPTRA